VFVWYIIVVERGITKCKINQKAQSSSEVTTVLKPDNAGEHLKNEGLNFYCSVWHFKSRKHRARPVVGLSTTTPPLQTVRKHQNARDVCKWHFLLVTCGRAGSTPDANLLTGAG